MTTKKGPALADPRFCLPFDTTSQTPATLPITPAGLHPLIQKASQMLRAAWMTQLSERLGFDLSDALSRHIKLLADLFQRVVGVHVDAKTHAQHLGFARRQPRQDVVRRFPESA